MISLGFDGVLLVAAETTSTEGLALHEAVVSLAIGCGGWLIHHIRTNNADISVRPHSGHARGLSRSAADSSSQPASKFSADDIEVARRRIFNAFSYSFLPTVAQGSGVLERRSAKLELVSGP